MSNNSSLQISRSFKLGEELAAAGSKFVRMEEELFREFESRQFSENRRYQDGIAAVETDLKRKTEVIVETFQRNETRIRQLHQQRRVRIERACRTASANLLKEAHGAKERWTSNLVFKHFQAAKGLPADLKKAEEAFQEFSAHLARLRTKLMHLRRRTRQSFAGYGAFLELLNQSNNSAEEIPPPSEDRIGLLTKFQENVDQAGRNLASFRRNRIPLIFSHLPLQISMSLAFVAGAVVGFFQTPNQSYFILPGAFGAGLAVAIFGLHRIGLLSSKRAAETLAASLADARRLYDTCSVVSAAEYEQERKQIQEAYEHTFAEIEAEWSQVDAIEQSFADTMRTKKELQAPRALAKNDRLLVPKLRQIESERDLELSTAIRAADAGKEQLAQARERGLALLVAQETVRWKELEVAWSREVMPIIEAIRTMNTVLEGCAPTWNEGLIESWKAPGSFPVAVQFATIKLDLTGLIPKDPRLALPGLSQVEIPLALTFPGQGSLLFETPDSGTSAVTGTLNNIVLRLLATTMPGKLSFTIIDPVGLGQNFAGLMHLSDFEESLINRRIWTQQHQIEERLEELNEHIEKVIQMYLRNDYATISEYNAQAGSVAEKYHFLVVADFPTNFSETAVKRLQSIASSGPRCGVFTLIHWDQRQPPPDGFVPDELQKNSVCIRRDRNQWIVGQEQPLTEGSLIFDPPPGPELEVDLVQKIGQSSIDSNRVEVPFTQIAPKPSEMWRGETAEELKVAIGLTGATKIQHLVLGRGTRQHALLAGKTGSGKSTLFHIIITNLALNYSPEQIELYLIDFKKGVEFKCYATRHLPHARVIAIESDREFALSVLQRVDEELRQRGDMFRKLGAQDLAGYKRGSGTETVPRTLLIIDEFQEFFVQDDQIAQTAALLFDRIVRQGRAFGIHVLLGSQTLGGAYTLARATLGQMVVRIALQCNEADASLIMDDNNPAPRLLSRPGEGIYNDAAGALEGNSPFQVVWLSDSERDHRLEQILTHASGLTDNPSVPIIFEGNAPADIRENLPLRSALESIPVAPPSSARCWLGAPNSIKGPTEVAFQRQSGNHLLLVGQRGEAMATMLGSSLIALASQYPIGTANFFLFHAGSDGERGGDFLERTARAIPHGVTVVRSNQVSDAMRELAATLKSREDEEAAVGAPSVFVLIHGLQKFKKLRHEDEFDFSSGSDFEPKPGAQLATLLAEGSSLGIHLIVTLDTFNNLNRFFTRKALSEFEMRVLFQMSISDSASLIDSPQAGNLGLHRALFYNEHDGRIETFRPYAVPTRDWTQEAFRKLATTHAVEYSASSGERSEQSITGSSLTTVS